MSTERRKSSLWNSMVLVFRKAILILLFVLCGCVTTAPQIYWSDWYPLRQTGSVQQKTATVQVSSVPEGAEVSVDGVLQGRTPLSLLLFYGVQPEVRERYLYRSTQHVNFTDSLIEGLTLGSVAAVPRTRSEVIDHQSREEQRPLESHYRVKVEKEGYLSYEFSVSIPRDDSRHLTAHLIPQEPLTIEPVQVFRGVEQRIPPLRWLKDRVFFPKGLSKRQYANLGRQVEDYLRLYLAKSQCFLSLDGPEAGSEEDAVGLNLSVEAAVYFERITLRGKLHGGRTPGGRVFLSEVSLSYEDLSAGLPAACEQLAAQLIQEYSARMPIP